jgi:hypothetical protein
MATFSASVSAWVRKSEARLTAVFRDSAQTVANEVRISKGNGGNMPVVTGNLRRSLMASTAEMPKMQRDNKVKFDTEAPITLVIAGAKLGETIHLGFQAVYSGVQEHRHRFVGLTAQRWPQIVRASGARIKKEVTGK